MSEEILKLQVMPVQEDEVDEVDGMRFSSASQGHCGNWSVISWNHC
ncbi:SapB/AmfS family lantipeptide [Streptococcus mutans]|nr:SapB/AmfS family lantipeptide [Streptococcus mutans]MDW5565743.1 SapB/AmfS family lantipeptide [Streptococcus mutans]